MEEIVVYWGDVDVTEGLIKETQGDWKLAFKYNAVMYLLGRVKL